MIAPDVDLLAGLRPCRHCPTCRWRRPQPCLCGVEGDGVCGRYPGAPADVDAWLDAWRPYGTVPLACGSCHDDILPGAPDCPGWESA